MGRGRAGDAVGEAAEVFGLPVGDMRIEAAGDLSEGVLGFVRDELVFLLIGGGLGEEVVELPDERLRNVGWGGHGFCRVAADQDSAFVSKSISARARSCLRRT